MLTRFTWTNWSKGQVLRHEANTWQGEHDGYKRLADPVKHKRTVMSLGEDRWLVVDHLDAAKTHHYALHWLFNDFPYEEGENALLLSLDSAKCKVQFGVVTGGSAFSIVRGDPGSTRGWRSRYYGDKEPAISVLLETDQPRVCFWTFFGHTSDVVQMHGETFSLVSRDRMTSINIETLVRTSH